MLRTRSFALLAILTLIVGACSSAAGPSQAPATSAAAPSQAPAATQAPATATATTSVAPATVGPLEATTIRVGFDGLPDLSIEMAAKWAADMKSQYGVDVKQVDLGSTAAPFRTLVSGNIDMIVGQMSPGILLRTQSGADIKMIAAFDTNSNYVLLATPNIKQASDLIGKKVGVAEAGSASEALTKATLTHASLDLTKVNLVHVGGTDARLAALVAGQIQAGPVDASVAYDAIAKGTGLHILLPMATVLPTYEFHVLWVSQAWLSAHPNLAQLAVNVLVASNRWAADNKAAYIALSNTNVTGLSDAVRSQTYDLFIQIKYFAINGGMDAASIASTISLDQSVGALPATVPDPATWTNASYVNNYLAANGTR